MRWTKIFRKDMSLEQRQNLYVQHHPRVLTLHYAWECIGDMASQYEAPTGMLVIGIMIQKRTSAHPQMILVPQVGRGILHRGIP